MHRLIIIGGKPGSGKTSVSRAIEKHGFSHLAIDDFYRQAPRDPTIADWSKDLMYLDTAYTLFREEIFRRLKNEEPLVIETTGAGTRWKKIFEELLQRYADQSLTIYLDVPKEVSMQRIHTRNQTDYDFKIDEEHLEAFIASSNGASVGYQHVINANRPQDEVIASVIALLD